jgi:DNA-binding response OmpR family regulator
MLVLIVEPDEDERELLASYLVGENFLLETARDAGQAMAKAVLIAPDVVLLNLDLPHAGAWEIFRRLRSSVHTSSIPVIGLSSRPGPALRARAQMARCGLLGRPFSPEDLVAAVRSARRPARRVARAGGRRLRFPPPPARIR